MLRQWRLLRTLSARRLGATVQEMAGELEVTEKTIRRDLNTFQQAGFPLSESVGERGRKSWRVRRTAYLAGSFGVFHSDGDVAIRIRFAPAVARYVQENRWHASQRLTPQRDGSLLAEFRLSGTEEIKRWVLSFGQQAEVLEPPSLVEELSQELRAALAGYGVREGAPAAAGARTAGAAAAARPRAESPRRNPTARGKPPRAGRK